MVEIRSRAPIHRGWRGRMRTMLALAAAASVEGAMSGPLGTSRSRPLRLEASSAKVPELLTGVTRGLQALLPTPSVSANMDEMQRWHEEAARSRLAAAQHGAQHLRGGSDFGMMKSKPNVLTKMQNGLSSSRAAIMWVIKGLLAAFTGLSEMMPDYLAGLVLAGAVVGSVLGSWVLTKLSPSHPTVLALGVSSLFTAAQYMNLQVVAHPKWYKFMGLASFIPPYLLTSILGCSSSGASITTKSTASKSLRFESPKKTAASSPARTRSPTKSSPTTPKTPRSTAEDKALKTPKTAHKSSVKTPSKSDKTPSKSTGKEHRTPRERKTPKSKL